MIVRLKKYENGNKNIFGLSVVLESEVKNSTIQTSKSFFYVKSLSDFFSLKNIKIGDQLLSLTHFDNIDFNVLSLIKMGQIFDIQF